MGNPTWSDSGVTPVAGLANPGKIVNGPDLTPGSNNPDTAHLDAYGVTRTAASRNCAGSTTTDFALEWPDLHGMVHQAIRERAACGVEELRRVNYDRLCLGVA